MLKNESNEYIIETQNLTKNYDGFLAVDDSSLHHTQREEIESEEMQSRPAKKGEHAFSIEIEIATLNEVGDRLSIEGILGELEEIGFVEDDVLEIKGVDGILRVELKEEELRKLFLKGRLLHHV